MKVGNGEPRVQKITPNMRRFLGLRAQESDAVHIPPAVAKRKFAIIGVLAVIIGGGYLLLRKRS